MKQRTTACIELTLAMVIVGSLSVVGKQVIAIFPVMLSSVLTLGLASVGMFFIHLLMVGKIPRLTLVQFKYLFFQALFGVVLFRIFFLYGLYWSTASMAGILIALTPVVIALLSISVLKERASRWVIAGIGISVLGVVMCQSSQLMLHRDWLMLAGIGLVLLAMVCEGLFTVIRKKLAYEALNPVTSNFWLCVTGMLLFLPFGLYELREFSLADQSLSDWGPIIYTAIFVNIISFILWFRGVDKVDATTAGVFTVVMPVTSVILSALILKEQVTGIMLSGILVVIAGLLLVIIPPEKLSAWCRSSQTKKHDQSREAKK